MRPKIAVSLIAFCLCASAVTRVDAGEGQRRVRVEGLTRGKRAVIRAFPRPRNTNTKGAIFGGWLMAEMERAARVAGVDHSGRACVTKAMTQGTFDKGVKLGNEVTFVPKVVREDKRSMTVKVRALARYVYSDEVHQVNEATFEVKKQRRSLWQRGKQLVRRLVRRGKRERDADPAIRRAVPEEYVTKGRVSEEFLLNQLDLAGARVATYHAKGAAFTRAVGPIEFFDRKAKVGDEMSFYATLEEVGKSSMTINVEGWSRRPGDDLQKKAMAGKLVFVAVDTDTGGSKRVDPLPETPLSIPMLSAAQ